MTQFAKLPGEGALYMGPVLCSLDLTMFWFLLSEPNVSNCLNRFAIENLMHGNNLQTDATTGPPPGPPNQANQRTYWLTNVMHHHAGSMQAI